MGADELVVPDVNPDNPDGQTDVNTPQFKMPEEVRAISDAGQLLNTGRRFQREDKERDILRSEVFAAWSGETPYDPAAQEESGRSWEFNVSTGFLEGVIPRAQAPLLDIGMDEDTMMQIDGELDTQRLEIIRRGVVRQVKAWGGWPNFWDLLTQEMCLFGFCNALFPDEESPWPVFVCQQDGLVHRRSPNDVNKLPIFVWRQSFQMFELYQRIMNKEAARIAGWNIENTQAGIMGASSNTIRPGTWNQWLDTEKALRDNGFAMSIRAGAKEIEVFHGFVREYNGKVSHLIALASNSKRKDSQNKSGIELFKLFDRFNRMSDILVYFALEAGDGLWHGAKGVGQRCLNIHAAIDRIRCLILNQAFLSGLIPAKVNSDEAQAKMNLSFGGGFCFFPPDVELQTQKFPALSPELFEVDQLMVSSANQRFGDVVPDTSGSQKGEETATKSTIDQTNKTIITRAGLRRVLNSYAQLVSIMVRRLCNPNSMDQDCVEFRQYVNQRGITDEMLMYISGARSFGQISDITGESVGTTGIAMSEFASNPYVNQEKLTRRRYIALLGPKAADEDMPPANDQLEFSKEKRKQYQEITSLVAGEPIEAMPDDLHEAHLEAGTGWMQAAIDGNIKASIGEITAVGQHMAPHLEALKRNPAKAQQAMAYEQKLKQMGNTLDQLEKVGQQTQAKLIQMNQVPAVA